MGIYILPITIGSMVFLPTGIICGYAIAIWALSRKGRSYWWCIVPALVLFLSNKRENKNKEE
jgi:hypothetical protein